MTLQIGDSPIVVVRDSDGEIRITVPVPTAVIGLY